MPLSVEIDPRSGFCGGVIRAIGKAEDFLAGDGAPLYSLGAIVHNEAELERLGAKGLVAVDAAEMEALPSGATLLIRAHGEPPATYVRARHAGLRLIDCTCPVVLRLQRDIRDAWNRLHADGRNGNLLIFGKIGHAEVLGLVGQTDGGALVVEDLPMLEAAVAEGRIDFSEPVEVFSQTTKNPDEYAALCARLRTLTDRLTVHDTICKQVATRHRELAEFARSHDVILFVAGEASSNGKVLFDLCLSANPRSYRVASPDTVRPGWFRPGDRVGVSGATSTPKWLLEAVAGTVRRLSPGEKFAGTAINP